MNYFATYNQQNDFFNNQSGRLYYFFPRELIPKGRYRGQKLIKLVRIKIPDNTSNTMATVPLITWVKYKVVIIAAIIIRTMRSTVPIFFFIKSSFNVQHKTTAIRTAAWEQMFH